MKLIVAIIGRPNVGKSTLFNRLTRSKTALVDDLPGVTRDRIYGDACWDGLTFTVVDTGGFPEFESQDFAPLVRYQVEQAIEAADAILMLFDGRQGVTPSDKDLAQRLRETRKAVFYCVNKIDGPQQESLLSDFYALGIDRFYPLSAEHGYGLQSLMDELIATFPAGEEAEPGGRQVRLAVVGRPNVGKSSLINCLLGDNRLVVSEQPGTTRDAVDTVCKVDDQEYLLIDTAGIRRKKSVRQKLEKFSILKSLKSLNRCHIAVLMLDAAAGVTDQDVRIAGYIAERRRACMVLLNKWDLIEKDPTTAKQHIDAVKYRLKFMRYAPVWTASALEGRRIFRIFDQTRTLYEQYTTRIGTGRLNRIIQDIIYHNEPTVYRGRRIKFYYATQTYTAPPTFVCFVNYPEGIHFSYKRYVTNRLREIVGMDKTPVRLIFRKREKK